MRIENIVLKNFRCYKDARIDLHPKMTVLVANNGHGKTAILDAIRIGLWPYVASFDLAHTSYPDTEPANTIVVDDALSTKADKGIARQLPAEIIITGDYGDGIKTWKRFRDNELIKAKTKDDAAAKAMKEYSTQLQAAIRDVYAEPIDLPVLCYYGPGMIWTEKKRIQKEKRNSEMIDRQIRTFAYRSSLDPASDYEQFKEWFTLSFFKIKELQIQKMSEGATLPIELDSYIESPMTVTQNVVNMLLKDTGWQNLTYSITHDRSLVMQHPLQGILKVDQLSDGIKNMLAMIADIAYRCMLLNAHLGIDAALKTKGIVMIDEVDMHLHPQWQQTVLDGLTRAFPNIQFIVTTHSPQILTTVKSESIRLLKERIDPDSGEVSTVVETPDTQSRGIASSDVLAWLMDIDPVPDVEEAKWLSEYKALIQMNEYESNEALQLRKKLEAHFGSDHQEILECDRLVRLTEMKANVSLRQQSDILSN